MAHSRYQRKQQPRTDIILFAGGLFCQEAVHRDNDHVGDGIRGDYPGGIF